MTENTPDAPWNKEPEQIKYPCEECGNLGDYEITLFPDNYTYFLCKKHSSELLPSLETLGRNKFLIICEVNY